MFLYYIWWLLEVVKFYFGDWFVVGLFLILGVVLGFFCQGWFCFVSFFSVLLHLLSTLYLISKWDIWETFMASKGLQHFFHCWLKIIGKQGLQYIWAFFPPTALSQITLFLKAPMLFVIGFFKIKICIYISWLINGYIYEVFFHAVLHTF